MRSFFTYLIVFFSFLLTFSCGEDRTYEYEEKTRHNHWMQEVMLDKYLWADTLASFEPAWKNYFSTPSQFLSTLVKKSGQKDKWSYVEIDTLNEDSHKKGNFNHIDSYGFDFTMMSDPTGHTTKQVLRVLTVYPNSPAERAGLKRNDYICSYDSYKITKKNMTKLQKGAGRLLEVCHLAENQSDATLYWNDTLMVSLGASGYVEDVAFPVVRVLEVEGKKIGYLMCTRLLESPVEKGLEGSGVYREMLDAAMAQLKASGVEEMVLDLRLCNDGTIEMAQRLASYVVELQKQSTMFAKTLWNHSNTSNNREYFYDPSVENLGLSRVCILTSAYTQGAAEWLIHALRHTMGANNVVLIGKATAGQNVMTAQVAHEYYIRLFPVVAYVADGEGNYDYGSLKPTVEVDEFSFLNLGEYGSMDDVLLYTAVDYILRGSQNDSLWD